MNYIKKWYLLGLQNKSNAQIYGAMEYTGTI